MELHRKRHGYRPDFFERKRKEAREVHKSSQMAHKALGIKGKMFVKKRYVEKALMKKTGKAEDDVNEVAVPAFLHDRENMTRAKVLSNTIKQKRKDRAGKWEVPLPKPRVRPVAEDEMFRVVRSGKHKTTQLKEDGDKSDIRWAWFHQKTSEVRTVYPSLRTTLS